ncbi:hypothetical protein KHA80_12540 [Anaerobacillus sp. HL2]|nr:hypothetical protein KHA80_12540 [Anaerobacillus sp. HL2]
MCRKDKEKCIDVVNNLYEYSYDQFEHILKPLDEYALYFLLGMVVRSYRRRDIGSEIG